MKELTLEEVAERVIWWKTAEEALKSPEHLIAHAMAHGLLEDIIVLQKTFGIDAFRSVLQHAPAGVFDEKSWVFWHLYLNMPLKVMPKRFPNH